MSLIGRSAQNVSFVLPWDGVALGGTYWFVPHILQTSQLLTSQGDFAALELASSFKCIQARTCLINFYERLLYDIQGEVKGLR